MSEPAPLPLPELGAEGESLDRLVDQAAPELATPAEGWTVRDTVVHLARADEAALLAVGNPGEFTARLPELARAVLQPHSPAPYPVLLQDWRATRTVLLESLAGLAAGSRIPWFGPAMGVRSFVTARLMETWAHGQDIADALGVRRPGTGRLRQVADLGVRTRGWSYTARSLPVPVDPVRVELLAPDGTRWNWGDPDAANRVRGKALDFCLLVTQRRHREDLSLEATGPLAAEWLTIAQAFAGAPTAGRPRRTTAR